MMITQLYRELRRLLWSWYSQDRIRVSPAEGRLLRILPGDLITMAGIDAEVVDRSVQEDAAAVYIRLTCRFGSRQGELMITAHDTVSPSLIWNEAGRRRHMDLADIQVWPINS